MLDLRCSQRWLQLWCKHWHKKYSRSSDLSAKGSIGSAHWTSTGANPPSVWAAHWPAPATPESKMGYKQEEVKNAGEKTRSRRSFEVMSPLHSAGCGVKLHIKQSMWSQISSLFLLHKPFAHLWGILFSMGRSTAPFQSRSHVLSRTLFLILWDCFFC